MSHTQNGFRNLKRIFQIIFHTCSERLKFLFNLVEFLLELWNVFLKCTEESDESEARRRNVPVIVPVGQSHRLIFRPSC